MSSILFKEAFHLICFAVYKFEVLELSIDIYTLLLLFKFLN
jgi:hypothetical protein